MKWTCQQFSPVGLWTSMSGFRRGKSILSTSRPLFRQSSKALLSIATLYSVIKQVLPNALAANKEGVKDELKSASSVRLAEDRIEYYYQRVISYFEGLADINTQLREYFENGVRKRHRYHSSGSGYSKRIVPSRGPKSFCWCYCCSCRQE